MVASSGPVERLSPNALHCSQDLTSSPEAAFALICEVEKWPVWLSCLRSARRVDETQPFGLGSEIALRGKLAGEEEEFYEVDQFLDGYIVSLVGAFSLRRRIDFRIERKSRTAKLSLRLDYPSYGGAVGALIDKMTARRRLDRALGDSLVHFKGLVEYKDVPSDHLLADF
ncbi:MAG: hypothetical protein IAI49_15535 [Candidatus Eremiobacteraeota bacterium]|nr:hypothetical protein [Candidatus Eremiobacteraeota bacterium]